MFRRRVVLFPRSVCRSHPYPLFVSAIDDDHVSDDDALSLALFVEGKYLRSLLSIILTPFHLRQYFLYMVGLALK